MATIETESSGGGIANSDGAPGQDPGTSEVQGAREGALNADLQSELQPIKPDKMEGETDNGNFYNTTDRVRKRQSYRRMENS